MVDNTGVHRVIANDAGSLGQGLGGLRDRQRGEPQQGEPRPARTADLLVGQHGRSEGLHAVTWNARGRSSGIYFYQLKTGDVVETRKMMLLK